MQGDDDQTRSITELHADTVTWLDERRDQRAAACSSVALKHGNGQRADRVK